MRQGMAGNQRVARRENIVHNHRSYFSEGSVRASSCYIVYFLYSRGSEQTFVPFREEDVADLDVRGEWLPETVGGRKQQQVGGGGGDGDSVLCDHLDERPRRVRVAVDECHHLELDMACLVF